jgi:hypothetical protein
MENTHNSLLIVILHNLKYIGEVAFSWILTIFGFNITSIGQTLTGIEVVLRIAALFLACTVSVATLYKIKRELK